jgi:hypothetical protein
MTHILGAGDVLKVGCAIIMLIPVYMIHLVAGRTWPQEGCGNYPVNNRALSVTVVRKEGIKIALSFIFASLGIRLQEAISSHAVNSTKVRDFIQVFVVSYVAPLFRCEFFFGKFKISHIANAPIIRGLVRLVQGLATLREPFYFTTKIRLFAGFLANFQAETRVGCVIHN